MIEKKINILQLKSIKSERLNLQYNKIILSMKENYLNRFGNQLDRYFSI